MPSTPVAPARRPIARSSAAGSPRWWATMWRKRLGVERVAGEDRDVLAEGDVAGRAAAAQLVVVHRRQVVVDQRVGVDQLERRRERHHLRGIAADRDRGREREHRADPLARREQRVAHRLDEPGEVGAVGEARPRRGRRRPARAGDRGRCARSRATTAALPCALAGSSAPARARRSSSTLASPASAAHSSTSVAAASAESSPERSCSPARSSRPISASSWSSGAAHGPSFSRTSRRIASSMPLTKPGASARAEHLRASRPPRRSRPRAGSAARPGRRRRAASRPARRAGSLRSSGAIRSTVQPCAWRPISSSSSGARSTAALRERARERAGVGPERLRERPAGEVVLVGGDHGGAPLLGAPRYGVSSRARHVVAAARVDADAVADVDEQRHVHLGAGLERRRLGAAARGGVAAQPRLGLGAPRGRRRSAAAGRPARRR